MKTKENWFMESIKQKQESKNEEECEVI